ncbi:hypothetical protein [Paenibacillus physcomitrellae]|uniref:Bacteriocin n=1 Tax=Paenibacillus physcomitrellae TaxID=1619311 RepID=A0ABQ1GST7_9BACL|nr:hypothetical protein [Paenibacillus physcomitrellae]GGA49228.1 hypothetical protein GCM10010917_38120 [Paenibacillus physcomitrellae]
MEDKVMESIGRTAIAGGGALSGAAVGAALGTAACPGIGTGIGYLVGVGIGCLGSVSLTNKWFKKENRYE